MTKRIFILIISIHIWGDIIKSTVLSAGEVNVLITDDSKGRVNDTALPKFKLQPCLLDFFLDVDNNRCSKIDTSNQYYLVVFKRQKNYDFLRITKEYWNVKDSVSFDAVIDVNRTFFYVKGDLVGDIRFVQDGFFELDEHRISQVVTQPIKPNFDEPYLRGMYNECVGNAIYIEIYLKGNYSIDHNSIKK